MKRLSFWRFSESPCLAYNGSMAKLETITLAGGCFWCIEAAYQMVRGITRVTSGYAGGTTPDPTYDQVASGRTDYAESVQLEFDLGLITLVEVLEIFWILHDPTTLNRQGHDVGRQYRSAIFYSTDEQRAVAERSKQATAKLWPKPIVAEITPLGDFYPAEAEHQDYFRHHPERAYCQVIINPKLAKLRQRFAERLTA